MPEAQLDRFLLRLPIGYPSVDDENQMLLNLQRQHPIETLEQVVDGTRLPELQRQVWEVHVDDTVRDYIVRLVYATREHPDLALGASPRGSLALFKTAQALVALRGRDYQPGDSPRRIDWKTSAALGRLQVRRYQPAISVEAFIMLNLSAGEYSRRGRFVAIELGIVVAASIASQLIEQWQAVGLATNGADPLAASPGLLTLSPRKGREPT